MSFLSKLALIKKGLRPDHECMAFQGLSKLALIKKGLRPQSLAIDRRGNSLSKLALIKKGLRRTHVRVFAEADTFKTCPD